MTERGKTYDDKVRSEAQIKLAISSALAAHNKEWVAGVEKIMEHFLDSRGDYIVIEEADWQRFKKDMGVR